MKESEARRLHQAKLAVAAVTVECPYCGLPVVARAGDPEDDSAVHTAERHTHARIMQCRRCLRRFEVPELSVLFHRIFPHRGRN